MPIRTVHYLNKATVGEVDADDALATTAGPANIRSRRKSARHKAAYHYLTSSSNSNDKKSKLTNRHLAALDFLLGIKLTNEATIRKEGQKLTVSINSIPSWSNSAHFLCLIRPWQMVLN